MAALFLAEIEEGIDSADYNGPAIVCTPHRAGLIKVATGENGFTPREEKIFEAAIAVHRSSGAPILTHTEQAQWGLEQIDFLHSRGAHLCQVVLSHTDRKPNNTYHKELLSTGVMLEYDSAFRWKAEWGNPTEDLVIEMFAAGYGRQILLGMDAARTDYWKSYGGKPGLAFLLKEFVPRLKSPGLSQSDIDSIFIHNPARCYSFHGL